MKKWRVPVSSPSSCRSMVGLSMNSLHRGSCYKIFTCGGEFSLLHPRVLSCNQFLFSLQFIYECDQSLAPIHLNSTRFCSRRHSNYYSTASSHHLTPEKSFPGKQVSFFIFYVLIINWMSGYFGSICHTWFRTQVANNTSPKPLCTSDNSTYK